MSSRDEETSDQLCPVMPSHMAFLPCRDALVMTARLLAFQWWFLLGRWVLFARVVGSSLHGSSRCSYVPFVGSCCKSHLIGEPGVHLGLFLVHSLQF